MVSHFFACPHPGYRGWRWSVTVVRAARAKVVTIDEVVLLPGEEALLGPDLGAVGRPDPAGRRDHRPADAGGRRRPRLVPGYTGGEAAADADPAEEA